MDKTLTIKGRLIGADHPVYIIAEISANHHQRYENAVRLIEAAAEAGVDAVKLQTYTADTITIDSPGDQFQIDAGSPWGGRRLYDLYQEAHTPWEWQPRLMQVANALGLALFSSPFDPTAVDFLEQMQVPAYKIASFEIVDIPLLQKVAATGKPVIVSTGMASEAEIEEALGALRGAGASQIALLKCTSAYPAAPGEMNLRTIPDMAARFGVPVGLSDHTLGIQVPIAALALGACVVEKHLTFSRREPGPDSAFSLEPPELRQLVQALREAQQSLGTVQYGASEREAANLVFRRSLYVVEDLRAGELFTAHNLRSIRPAHGLHPRHLGEVLGRQAAQDLPRGTALAWEHVEGQKLG